MLFAAHEHQLAHFIGFAGAAVHDGRGAGKRARDHLDIAQLAHKGIGHGFEHTGHQRLRAIGLQLHRLASLICSQHIACIHRAGQQHAHIVKQHIQCLLVHSAAAEHRRDLAAVYAVAHTFHDLLGGEGLAAEEFFHQSIIRFSNGFAHSLDHTGIGVADIGHIHLHLLAALVFKGLLAEQVDIHLRAIVQTGRNHTGAHGGAKLDLKVGQDLAEVGVFQIHFANEYHAGLAVFHRQMISLFRANGHAAAAGNTDQHAFGGHNALALAQFKIKQARSVDQVKFITLALHRNHCQIQRCQTAGFLGVKVAYGGAILYSAHALKRTGGIQQCFCKGGFAASGMTGQHDISDIFALVIQRLTPLSHLPWQVLIQFIQK